MVTRGPPQADRYLDELDTGIEQLATNPELDANRDYVREGYRVVHINSHAIYYTVASSAIHVIRVLNAEIDPSRHPATLNPYLYPWGGA